MQGTAGSRPRGRMVSLGRVTAPKPVNLPSQKRENNGNDPNIPLVPKTVSSSVWGSQAGGGDAPPVQGPPQQAPPPAQPAQGQPAGAAWGGAGGSDRRQASALLAQDEFPTLGAATAESVPNGVPYAHAPQDYANGLPPSHPSMDRAPWDGPGHVASYGKSGSPGSFNSNSWGAPTGERWADSAPPMRPAQGYGGPPPLPYGGIDAQMDMQGPPYMPSQGAGYMPFNQPPPPPPRTRPPSASDPSGPRYMPTPPEYPGRQQGQHVGGPAVHGHGQGQYEGHGPLQSFGAASMGGTGYQPPHLRNRDRGEGMPRPGSEWSIAAQPSESIPDEVPQQTTPSKILRNPAAPQSVPQAVPSLQQQQHVQHHRAGEGHHRSAHGAMQSQSEHVAAMQTRPDQAAMHPRPPQQPQHQHQHHHSQQRSQAPPAPVQGHGVPQPPRLSVPQQQPQPQPPPPPPQQQQQQQQQHLQQPGEQRLQFGQLGSPGQSGSPPGDSRDDGRQQQMPSGLLLPNGHMPQSQGGPLGRLQHQHSAGQGFSPKVAQQLGLHRPESAQDRPVSSGGQATQASGPIMTFGQPAHKPQHQPPAPSSRPPSSPEAPASKAPLAEGGQSAVLNELEQQKAYMRQKVQQRQQVAAKMQQQAPTVGQRSASEASRRSIPQSAAQHEPAEHAEQPMPGSQGPSGPGRGQRGQGPGRGGRGHDAGRGRGQGRREMQHPRPSEAQALERALPQNLSLSPSEQLIMEAKMRSMSLEANRAAVASGPPQHQRQQQHPQQQRQQQQQQHQQARGEHDGAPAGAEGSHRRPNILRDSQPKAVPIVTASRESSARREAPGPSQQQRRPSAVPIAVAVPERRAQRAEGAEGRPPAEARPLQHEQRGPRREKQSRDRPPPSGVAAPVEGSQAPVGSSQVPLAAAESETSPPQGLEQSVAGPPGVNRRGSRRGTGQRNERSAGQGTQARGAHVVTEAVDAPPGLGTSQVAPHAAEEQHSAPAEQVDHDMPGAERMEYRERVPRSSRRERGQRERLPRPVAAALGGAAVESDAATEGKGSEPAEGEPGQSSIREARRRPNERAPKKPRSSADAALGQQLQAPPGLGGRSAQTGQPNTAPEQASRRERSERELYHPPVNETTGPSEAQGEANADAPLHMTDGKPPGLGRPRAKHGRERRDRRRPLNSAADRADGEHIEQGPPQEGGDPYDGAMAGGTQAEEGNRPRQQRGQGHRVSRGGSGGGRGRGHEGNPASADGGQEGSSNADVKGAEEGHNQDGLPSRSSRSGRGRGPRGGGRNGASQDGAPMEAGEVRASDGEAGKVRTLEVARGTIDAKGKRVWTVKDGPVEGSQGTAEKPSTGEGGPSGST